MIAHAARPAARAAPTPIAIFSPVENVTEGMPVAGSTVTVEPSDAIVVVLPSDDGATALPSPLPSLSVGIEPSSVLLVGATVTAGAGGKPLCVGADVDAGASVRVGANGVGARGAGRRGGRGGATGSGAVTRGWTRLLVIGWLAGWGRDGGSSGVDDDRGAGAEDGMNTDVGGTGAGAGVDVLTASTEGGATGGATAATGTKGNGTAAAFTALRVTAVDEGGGAGVDAVFAGRTTAARGARAPKVSTARERIIVRPGW